MSDNKITSIITRETVGMDQLEAFDSTGQAGPCVTLELALTEVKRLARLNARLNAVLEAAKSDIEDAKVNCGKYSDNRDCTAGTDRDMTCSDCPVEFFEFTREAIAAVGENDE